MLSVLCFQMRKHKAFQYNEEKKGKRKKKRKKKKQVLS